MAHFSKITLSKHCIGTLITEKPHILMDSKSCIDKIQEILDREGVQCLGDITHDFPNKSFTSVIVLAESHIALHTWPERHAVQLDVFLCNYINDNSNKCRRIFESIIEYFDPVEVNETYIDRL